MKLEQQVTSLEISKKLKELGVKQESISGYRLITITNDNGEKVGEEWYLSTTEHEQTWNKKNEFSAFTVAELGEMLPQGCASYRNKKGNWDCVPPVTMQHLPTIKFMDTEANARGNMLIYLIEDKLITP